MRVTQRGAWPGPISFRRGWARASARPWNDAIADASLRVARGAAGFLGACTHHLIDCGAPAVLSPPLPLPAQNSWLQVGYRRFMPLALMRLALDRAIPAPDHLVVEVPADNLDDLLRIDAAAFSEFWHFDEPGLREAMNTTGRGSVLIIRGADGHAAAYAVVGSGSAVAYLQRVAVHPDWQGQGMGRSLIRVAGRKARTASARIMLLNTQVDNESALALYRSEGYVRLPDPLSLMRYGP